MHNPRPDNRGFTIAELSVVLAIIAIMAVMVSAFVIMVNNWVQVSTQRYNAYLSQGTAETAFKNFINAYDSSEYYFTTKLSETDSKLLDNPNWESDKTEVKKSILKDLEAKPAEGTALYVYDSYDADAQCVAYLYFEPAPQYSSAEENNSETNSNEPGKLWVCKTVENPEVANPADSADEVVYQRGAYPLDYTSEITCFIKTNETTGQQLFISRVTYSLVDYNSKIPQSETETIAIAIHAKHKESADEKVASSTNLE